MIKWLLVIYLAFLTTAFNDDGIMKKYQIILHRNSTSRDYPQKGEIIRVHYVGRFPGGHIYDSSIARDLPFEFRMGMGKVIVCWDEVIARMSIGDKITVFCPQHTAYGADGYGGVPKYQDIFYDIERLSTDEEL